MTQALRSTKPRIRLDRWPVLCSYYGCRWVYVALWPDHDSGVVVGCVRANSLVNIVRAVVA